jgi:NhaP-type Na+/H+ or K+/H+ antiporter
VDVGFAEALLLIGVILTLTAALSGWLHGTVLSATVLSLGAGVLLSVADVISIGPDAETVVILVEVALVLTLLSDGLLVERELLTNDWHAPARALVFAMPITLALLAAAAKLLFPTLSWAEAFLLGAVLAPTDPVITSAVVTAQHVPRVIRHTLNLESGLNDGLALPFVLFFLVLATRQGGAAGEAAQLAGEAVAGGVIGVALALVAGRSLGHLPGGGITARYEGLFALGLGFAAFGLAEVTLGNGLIAVFAAGIALAVARHEIPDAFVHFNESVSAAFQVLTFVVFGALIVSTGWGGDTLALIAFIAFALFVARPAAVLLSLIGIDLPGVYKVFIAWFGPKGVASMLFALFVLSSSDPNRTLVFDIASFTVVGSIVAHGLTDTLGARWIERRLARSARAEDDGVREGVEPDQRHAAQPVVAPARAEQGADDRHGGE